MLFETSNAFLSSFQSFDVKMNLFCCSLQHSVLNKIQAPPLQIQGVFKDLAVFQGVIPGPCKPCKYFFKNEQRVLKPQVFKPDNTQLQVF